MCVSLFYSQCHETISLAWGGHSRSLIHFQAYQITSIQLKAQWTTSQLVMHHIFILFCEWSKKTSIKLSLLLNLPTCLSTTNSCRKKIKGIIPSPENKPLLNFISENYTQNHISKCLLPNIFLNVLTDIRHLWNNINIWANPNSPTKFRPDVN